MTGVQESPADSVSVARQALAERPNDTDALRALAAHLTRGELAEDLRRWHLERARSEQATNWLQALIADALQHGRLAEAEASASVYALLRWGGAANTDIQRSMIEPPGSLPTPPQLTAAKLRHDIDQFEYLRQHRAMDPDLLEDWKNSCRRALIRLRRSGTDRRLFETADHMELSSCFNRIVYLPSVGRVPLTLSDAWSRDAVQTVFAKRRGGVVVIDDFLTREALEALRAFCLESTVWFANRYAFGRLGAFFYDGFACPLLTQIAEELRKQLPLIFQVQYPLSQVWAFKNTEPLPPNAALHADFAAVSANLWLTPDQANQLPNQGGLTIYDTDAPLNWDFKTYNGRTDVIRAFLAAQGARALHIPYKQNRMIIFNADLFHGTQEVRFKPEYASHRINVSWLYGRRENDLHHPRMHAPLVLRRPTRSWRSRSLRGL